MGQRQTVRRQPRYFRGHVEAAVMRVFETRLSASTTRVAEVTGLGYPSVCACLNRLLRDGEIMKAGDHKHGAWFLTFRQRAAL